MIILKKSTHCLEAFGGLGTQDTSTVVSERKDSYIYIRIVYSIECSTSCFAILPSLHFSNVCHHFLFLLHLVPYTLMFFSLTRASCSSWIKRLVSGATSGSCSRILSALKTGNACTILYLFCSCFPYQEPVTSLLFVCLSFCLFLFCFLCVF